MMHWKAKVKHRELHWHKIEKENEFSAEMRDKWAVSSGYNLGPTKGTWFKEMVKVPRLEQPDWNDRFFDIRSRNDRLEEFMAQKAPPILMAPIARDLEDPYPSESEDLDKKFRLAPWPDSKWDYEVKEKDLWHPDICGV